MSGPLVTVGVPVYRGKTELPVTLECLKTQTYPHLDVLVSVDAGDQESAKACEPFVRGDSRFRMHVQPHRLGWAANTDWTMRERRGEFYIFQQHDDQVSPSYIEDLVSAALRAPDAAICFAEMQCTGLRTMLLRGFPLSGSPIERATAYVETLDAVPFRGLIRSSALASTSGLLLSEVDPFESFGTEFRFMTELALLGEFRFVKGPTYYKRMHGTNLHLKRENWSNEKKRLAWACLCAWMVEVIVPAGRNPQECRRLFDTVLARFLDAGHSWRRLKSWGRRLAWSRSSALSPIRALVDRVRSNEQAMKSLRGRWMFYEAEGREQRAALVRTIFGQLKREGRFDPMFCFQRSWEALEDEANKRFVGVS